MAAMLIYTVNRCTAGSNYW